MEEEIRTIKYTIPSERETEAAKPKMGFVVSGIKYASETSTEGQDLFYRGFESFQQLRAEVEKSGYTMSMPFRNKRWPKNEAIVVIMKDGITVSTLLINATGDLRQGVTIAPERDQLKG
jgi:hypothetical protein